MLYSGQLQVFGLAAGATQAQKLVTAAYSFSLFRQDADY